MPELVVGLLYPITGGSSDTALQCNEAAQVAADMFAPPGWTIRFVLGDPKSPEVAATEAERLVTHEGAHVLIGTLRSELCLAASEVSERLGATFWASAGTAADEITRRGLRYIFRLGGSASGCYADAAVEFLADVLAPMWGVKPADLPIAAALEDTPFPQSFGRTTLEKAAARGFRSVASVTVLAASSDYREQVANLASSGAAFLFAAGFGATVAPLWRQMRERRLPLRSIVGISGWAFPRDKEIQRTGYGRAFTLGGPYLFSADRNGLAAEPRRLLESWWARSATPAAQDVALDRDLTFSALWVLFQHVLPKIQRPDAESIRAAALEVDLPMGASPIGFGCKFDETGDNLRAYALVMQWQNAKRVTVHPKRFAVAPIEPGSVWGD